MWSQTRSPNLHPSLTLWLLSHSSLPCVLSQHRPPRVACAHWCVRALLDQMHSVRQSTAAGRSAALSSHYGSLTHVHACTCTGSQRGTAHRDCSPHTHWSKQCICQKREVFHGTHTGVGGLSPCPCSGQPNYLSAPHCVPSVPSLVPALSSSLYLC